jgi:uncharacterized tellurite resistance protein B-like protein
MAKLKEHIDTITDLMLGAAYADKRLEGKELDAIRSMLCKLLGVDDLPAEQAARIKAFNPAKHKPVAAAQSLGELTDEERSKVLDLIASVNDADDVIDMDEDAYLRKVAEGLGLSAEDIDDLTIEIIEEDDLDHFFDEAFEE